ncbi:MAG: M56 family metallopeptidase [Saprospiraceae bacterium]|nr:M56 family metallopeptidase [Saprospiraceae bacterium]
MMFYLFHVTILVSASYFFYKVFLQRETFFQLNRWVLTGSIVLAFSLPFLQIPQEWSLRSGKETVFAFEGKNKATSPKPDLKLPQLNVKEKSKTPSNAMEKVPQKNISMKKTAVVERGDSLVKASSPAPYTSVPKKWKISWITLVQYLYLTGLVVFLMNFLIQLGILLYKKYRLPYILDGKIRIVELRGDEAPYSFMGSIFINPEKYDWETYEQILEHEKIHVRQGHSIDIILAEIMVVVQWFNPFAWFHRKALADNLEYITDKQMLHKGTNRESYQMNLLRVAVPQHALHLTNNYNQSILKKRIFMMNSKKSSYRSSWKYLFLIPLFGFSVATLNAIKTAETSNQLSAKIPQADAFQSVDQIPGLHTTPENNPKPVTARSIAEQYNLSLDRFSTGHWTAKIKNTEVCFTFKAPSEDFNGNWKKSTCFKASEFTPSLTNTLNSFKLEREAGSISFKGIFTGKEGEGTYAFTENETFKAYLKEEGYLGDDEDFLFHCFFGNINKAYLAYLKKEKFDFDGDDLLALGHFEMKQEVLEKNYETFSGFGFKKPTLEDLMTIQIHEIKPEYVKSLQKLGLTDLDWEEVAALSIHDVTPAYVKSLQDEGFTNLSTEEVVAFAIHDVKPEDIKAFKNMGFRDMTPEDIVAASIHDVTPEYLASFEKEGLGKLSMEEITQFAIHDVKPEDIKAFKNMGFRDMTPEDIVAASIHDVTPEYLASFEKEGLGKLSMEEITQFAIHDVKPENIKAFQNMGFRDMTPEDIVAASIHDVTPEYLASFEKEGLGKLSMEEITQFAIHDVKPENIKAFQNMGFRDMTPEDIVAATIFDITPEYLASFEKEGMGKMSMEEITQFSIHDVKPSDIKKFKSLGFKNLSAEDIIMATIHDVTPEYISSIKALGFKEATMEEFVQAKIHDITAEYIKQKQTEGKKGLSLEKYIELKIHPMD